MKRSSCSVDHTESVSTYSADGERIGTSRSFGSGAEGPKSDFRDVSSNDGGDFTLERKRRRGVIEKKRRDRINNSLAELRRLVPDAQDKVATRVEKTEILQLTVDYLQQMLSTPMSMQLEGVDRATGSDFRHIGFRECITEVRKYLTQVEGIDTQNPLQQGLMNHLSTHASQIVLRHPHGQPMPPPAAIQTQWSLGSNPNYNQAPGTPVAGGNRDRRAGLGESVTVSPGVLGHPLQYVQQEILGVSQGYSPASLPAYSPHGSRLPANHWPNQDHPQVALPPRALL